VIEELSSHETFLHRVVRISYVALSHNERDLTHSSTLTRRAQEEGPRVPADATPSGFGGGGGGEDGGGGGGGGGGDDDPPLLIPAHVLAPGDSESDEDEVVGGEAAGSESHSPHHVSGSSSGGGIARGGLFGVGLAAGLVVGWCTLEPGATLVHSSAQRKHLLWGTVVLGWFQ